MYTAPLRQKQAQIARSALASRAPSAVEARQALRYVEHHDRQARRGRRPSISEDVAKGLIAPELASANAAVLAINNLLARADALESSDDDDDAGEVAAPPAAKAHLKVRMPSPERKAAAPATASEVLVKAAGAVRAGARVSRRRRLYQQASRDFLNLLERLNLEEPKEAERPPFGRVADLRAQRRQQERAGGGFRMASRPASALASAPASSDFVYASHRYRLPGGPPRVVARVARPHMEEISLGVRGRGGSR